jgi:sigma-B regulation protein RsbU (phosphoserine phosphatase)
MACCRPAINYYWAVMILPEPQFARSEVLRVFNHAQIYLFLGAAITTIGFLAASFSLLRRRFDPLLLWFALFAILYGIRLEMNYQLLWALYLRPPIFQRIEIAIDFLLPIPAFFFFRALHLLDGAGRLLIAIVVPAEICLAVATLFMGPQLSLRIINNSIVIAALLVLISSLLRSRDRSNDLVLIRRGLFVFIACAIYDNVTGIANRYYYNIEPFSFLLLLVALGIVAGRRALATEQQLSIIQKELEIARRIQLSILPSAFPASDSFRVAARYLPMTSVAGDFYDFLLGNNNEAGLLIADVSGHGVPAALIASMVKLAATAQHPNANDPASLLLGMNSTLCGNTQSQFVTAGYVYLNASQGQLRYSAAAHPPMLLLRNGEVTEFTENGLMLAAFDFASYTTLCSTIEPGDRLVLYTDGLLEAANAKEEEFGRERLHDVVRQSGSLSHTEAADRIIASIQSWATAQNDDLTVLICDYKA